MIVTGPHVVTWVAARIAGSFGDAVGFGVEKNGALCAGVVFDNYMGSSMCIHVASDGSRRWMTKELLTRVFDYAFTYCKVEVLIGVVGSSNTDALEFDKNLGFVEEHRIKGAYKGGDLVILTMRKAQCRFLGKANELKTA